MSTQNIRSIVIDFTNDLTKVFPDKVFFIMTREYDGQEDTTRLVDNNEVICLVSMIVPSNY